MGEQIMRWMPWMMLMGWLAVVVVRVMSICLRNDNLVSYAASLQAFHSSCNTQQATP